MFGLSGRRFESAKKSQALVCFDCFPFFETTHTGRKGSWRLFELYAVEGSKETANKNGG